MHDFEPVVKKSKVEPFSSGNTASIEIDSLYGIDFFSSITRAKFESLCMHLFKNAWIQL